MLNYGSRTIVLEHISDLILKLYIFIQVISHRTGKMVPGLDIAIEKNKESDYRFGLVYGAEHHFQQYFSYILTVSFIGGGTWNIRRKPLTCHKSLTKLSHNVVSNTPQMSGIRTHNISSDCY